MTDFAITDFLDEKCKSVKCHYYLVIDTPRLESDRECNTRKNWFVKNSEHVRDEEGNQQLLDLLYLLVGFSDHSKQANYRVFLVFFFFFKAVAFLW